VHSQQRNEELLQVFEHLNEDVSRWVRTAVLESLGPFIAAFGPGNEVPFILVDNYERMATADADMVLSCAFNFPAVVYTLGPSHWNRLKATFVKLSSDMQWKARRTLSYSIHEIANIVGTAATEEDLVPVFDLYLRDLDDVKIGVITNYAKFLKHLKSSTRRIFLEKLSELQAQTNGWRFREILAGQLPEICDLCEGDETFQILVPQSLTFCRDGVNVVRLAAISGVCHILRALKIRGKPQMFEEYANEIKKLGTQTSFSGRQFYAQICGDLVASIEPRDFATLFLPLLIALSNDLVVNVRLSVAITLNTKVRKIPFFEENQFVLATLEKLRQDEDPDVAHLSS